MMCKSWSSGVDKQQDLQRRVARPEDLEAARSLRRAAQIVSESAFAVARTQPNVMVSQLVVLSADIDRLAALIDGRDTKS